MPSLKRNPTVEERAAAMYSQDLPYHNFSHALYTVSVGEKIVERCLKLGVQMDWEVVYYALLFHDAGYHEDHLEKGFESKEAYSASLAQQTLEEIGVRPEVINMVKRSILSTERGAACHSNEEKVVCTADLSGIASDYDKFRADTEHLKKEQELLTGKPISWDEWLDDVAKNIEFFLDRDIHLTNDKSEFGEVSFQKTARDNLARLRKEVSKA